MTMFYGYGPSSLVAVGLEVQSNRILIYLIADQVTKTFCLEVNFSQRWIILSNELILSL